MKNYGKVIFAGMLLAGSLSAAAQQIPKKLVLVEKWSGTWCEPCTGAARAMEELDSEGRQVILISYQIEKDDIQKEKFETEEGRARADYYGGVDSYPTTRIDGTSVYKGGHWSASIYPVIFPLYEEAVAKKTSFDIAVASLERQNVTDFKASVEVNKVAPYTSDNLSLRFAIVEKVIPEPWQNMKELHYVQRDMYPDAEGVKVVFDGSDKQTVEIAGSIKAEWQEKELEIVCFIQDDDTKEVLQTVAYPFSRKEVQKRGSRTCNFNEVDCYWYMVSAFDDELKGYRVYSEDGKLLSEVGSDVNHYTYLADEPGGVSVRVSAVYAEGGETEQSPLISGGCYRNTLAGSPRYLSFAADAGVNNKGTLSWQPYEDVEENALAFRGFNELTENPDGSFDTDKKGGPFMENVWVVYSFDAADTYSYRGLNLSTISFIPGYEYAGYELGIFCDDELVYTEDLTGLSLKDGEWFDHKLSRPFFISGTSELKVGYKVSNLSSMPINIDKGPVIAAGKTNLIGISEGDGIRWDELYKGNNIIRLGFNIPDGQGEYPVGKTFKGYMVYRNGVSVLSAPQQETSFSVLGNATDGIYSVTAVYDECESVVSNAVQVGDVSVSSEYADGQTIKIGTSSRSIIISGDYNMVEVYDLCGRAVYRGAAEGGILDMQESGIYIVKVLAANGETEIGKVIIR